MDTETANVGPTNPLVRALLTDLYQLTMTYAHWRIGKANDPSVFELFFRKNPFQGEYTVFCGLDECLKLLRTFSFADDDISYLKSTQALSHCEDGFFEYLSNLGTPDAMKSLKVSAMKEGTIAFPRCPLITIEGPLGIGHLLETTLLNLVNYPSLIATNASRMVLRATKATTSSEAAKPPQSTSATTTTTSIPCIEFGLRRAQGPDGACSASKYSYVGGFVGTSNVQAGKMFGIPIAGTHAHSYIQSFLSLDDAKGLTLLHKGSNTDRIFLDTVLQYRSSSSSSKTTTTNDGELAAFVTYACAFPDNCLCLIDTYNTLESGLPNFISVAKALLEFGYTPRGVRLDSGDLVALSNGCKAAFDKVVVATSESEEKVAAAFRNLTIIASNDINEATLERFANTNHSLTAFGIGTNLVTCQAQPALGCVYKLVECKGEPRIKLSEEMTKVTLPGRKCVYRLYGGPNHKTPLVDYMTLADEEPPTSTNGEGILCRDPFRHQYRIRVFPSKVKALQTVMFDGGKLSDAATTTVDPKALSETRRYVQMQLLEEFPEAVTRYEHPTKHDVMVSPLLYGYLHELWEKNAPIPERR